MNDLTKSLFHLLLDAKSRGTNPDMTDSDEAAFLSFILKRAPISHAQLFQDLWVLFETRCKRNGYFVEFGATDGESLSNSYLLERSFGWRGIVAEPNPIFADTLRAKRKCYVSTLCVTARTGEKVPFVQTRDPLFATISAYSESDHNADARRGGTSILVETISLNDLLAQANAPAEIDFLSIDTEGSEFDILSSFDFTSHHIAMICVEHNFTARRQDIHALLSAHGYRRKFAEHTKWDDWYIRTPD